jgi:hypothetical protein
MALVATPATAVNVASVANGRSKAAELLSESGFQRIDQQKHKFVPNVSGLTKWRTKLRPYAFKLLQAHFDKDAAGVAKYTPRVLELLQPFWDIPQASEIGLKDADCLRTWGDYIVLAVIVSKNPSLEAVRAARIALAEAVNHPKAASSAEAQKVREVLALARELLGDDVVSFTPDDAGMIDELRLDSTEMDEMDEAVLGARLGGPSSSKKQKRVRFEPSPSRCATNGSDSGSDLNSQETVNAYMYDDVVQEAFALAERQKKRKHKRARCIIEEPDEWDAHDGHIDYGDAQGATDDEEW